MAAPVNIEVYNKQFERVGWLNDPQEVTITPRHLAIGGAEITITTDHPKLALIGARGARAVISYDGGVMSGVVRDIQGQGGNTSGEVTLTVEDDVRLLWRILAWPNPDQALSNQTSARDDRSGPAETVVKGYIADNAARLGLPVTVAPDQGRGSNVKASIRMQPLADRLIPALTGSGVGLSVVQDGAGLLVDCYETNEYPFTLTEASGIVQSWEWTTTGPELTRVVVGGQGEGVAREFVSSVDTIRESDWADVIEGFVDARDIEDPSDLPERGFTARSEARATAGLAITLAQSEGFRYGTSVQVGDVVTIDVGNGITVTDVLSAATITWTNDAGYQTVPVIGEREGLPTYKFIRKIVNLSRTVRNLNTI